MERISVTTARNVVMAIRPYLFLSEIVTDLVTAISENFSLKGGTTEELIMDVEERMETRTFTAPNLDGKTVSLTLDGWVSYYKKEMDVTQINDEDVYPLASRFTKMNKTGLINYWLVASYSDDIKRLSNKLFMRIFILLFDYKTIIEEDIKRMPFSLDDEAPGAEMNELAKTLLALDEKAGTTQVRILYQIDKDLAVDFANEPQEELLETGEKKITYREDHSILIRRWVEIMIQNITEKSFNTLISNSELLEALLILTPEGILFKKMIYFHLTVHQRMLTYDFINARGRLEYIMDAADIYKAVLQDYIFNMLINENMVSADIREKTEFERKMNNQYMTTLEGSILRPDSDKSFKRYQIQQLSDKLDKVSKYPGGISSLVQYESEIRYKDDVPESLDEFGVKPDLHEEQILEQQQLVGETFFPSTFKYLKKAKDDLEKKKKEKKEDEKGDEGEVVYDK